MAKRLSIMAFVLSFMFFIPFLPTIGMILGIMSLLKKNPLKGLSVAAIVIGFLMTIGTIIFLGSFFLAMLSAYYMI